MKNPVLSIDEQEPTKILRADRPPTEGFVTIVDGHVSRKLVAGFAADVEGYSRLMGTDEVGTLRGLTERRAIRSEPLSGNTKFIAAFFLTGERQ